MRFHQLEEQEETWSLCVYIKGYMDEEHDTRRAHWSGLLKRLMPLSHLHLSEVIKWKCR